MRRVALLENTISKFGVLGCMTRALRDAFEAIGVQTTVYEVQGDPEPEFFEAVKKEAPDCTWSINIFMDESSLYYPCGIPHVELSVDSLTYYHPFALKSPHLVPLFVDKSSCDLLSLYGGNRSHWFPHAISQKTIDHVRSLPPIPLERRPFDVTLLGSFLDHWQARKIWETHFSPIDAKAFMSFAERSLVDSSFELLSEVLLYFENTPRVKDVIERAHLSPFSLANTIELYARGLDRERLLKALKGRNIQIFTGIEDAVLWSKEEAAKEALFCPPVPFDEVIDICRMSKVAINSAPHIRKGYHERLFLSLASGAVTVAGKGRLPAWLQEEGRLVEYDGNSLDDLLVRVQEAERRPYNQEKVLSWLEAEHTWEARLRQLLPEIEKDVLEIRTRWENDPFMRLAGDSF